MLSGLLSVLRLIRRTGVSADTIKVQAPLSQASCTGSGDVELHNLIEALEADEAVTRDSRALARATSKRGQTKMLLEGAGTGFRGPPEKRHAGQHTVLRSIPLIASQKTPGRHEVFR